MKLVKIIYKLRLSDGDKCARESIFSSGPEMCAKSYIYIFFDIMLGKMFIVHVCGVYGSPSSSVHRTAWLAVHTNHKSFYSSLTLCARLKEREHEKTYTITDEVNKNRKQNPKTNWKRALARVRERPYPSAYVSTTNFVWKQTY